MRTVKKILITGGSGLLAVNWSIVNSANYDFVLGLHNRNIAPSGIKTQYVDLVDERILRKDIDKVRPDFIIHTVAATSVEYCEANPETAKQVNTILAGNVAKLCADLSIPLVHISTDHLFSGKRPFENETAIVEPLNVYAKTKADAEKIVLELHKGALVIRTNFFGWGTSYRQSFSDVILTSLRKGQEIRLFDDAYYTPIAINNLTSAVHELIDKGEKGVFHVVGNERLSKYDFGCKIAKQFALPEHLIKRISIKEKPELVKRPLDMSLSNQKLINILGRKLNDLDTDISDLSNFEKNGLAARLNSL